MYVSTGNWSTLLQCEVDSNSLGFSWLHKSFHKSICIDLCCLISTLFLYNCKHNTKLLELRSCTHTHTHTSTHTHTHSLSHTHTPVVEGLRAAVVMMWTKRVLVRTLQGVWWAVGGMTRGAVWTGAVITWLLVVRVFLLLRLLLR